MCFPKKLTATSIIVKAANADTQNTGVLSTHFKIGPMASLPRRNSCNVL